MMIEGRYLSVSFCTSLTITSVGALVAIFDKNNALWITTATSPGPHQLDVMINLCIYLAPLASFGFFYAMEAFSETNQAMVDALADVPCAEWYLRLFSQVILGLTWFLLSLNLFVFFIIAHLVFYVAIIVWDIVVIQNARGRSELNFLYRHDLFGLILTVVYSGMLLWLHLSRDSFRHAEAYSSDAVAQIIAFTLGLSFIVALHIFNIAAAIKTSKLRLSLNLLPPLHGRRGG